MTQGYRSQKPGPAWCAGACFAAALSGCLLLRPALTFSPESEPASGKGRGGGMAPLTTMQSVQSGAAALRFRATAGDSLTPDEILALAGRAGRLTTGEMKTLLTELDAEAELDPQIIKALLVRWVRQDPGAALRWSLNRPKNRAGSDLFSEITGVWALADPAGLRQWCLLEFPINQQLRERNNLVIGKLAEANAVEAAKLCEEGGPELAQNSGFAMIRWAHSVTDIKPVLDLALRKSGFQGEADGQTRAQPLPGAEIWQELAQAAASRWSELDPGAFSQWLASQPPEVRTKSENASRFHRATMGGMEDWDPPPVLDPATSPPPLFARAETPPLPLPETFPAICQEWGRWWHRNPTEAGDFLEQSAWPEAFKFRARAAALANPP